MEKYRSRKFIVTLFCAVSAVALASVGKMSGDVATVLMACVAAYNLGQAYIDGKNTD